MSVRRTGPSAVRPDAPPVAAGRKRREIAPAPDGRARRQFNTYLPTETLAGLRAVSRVDQQEKWEVFQRALEEYIGVWKRQQAQKASAASTEERTAEGPASEEPTTEEPATEDPATEEPTTEGVDWQTFNSLATVDVIVAVERIRTHDRVEIREVARRAVDLYVAVWALKNPGII
ncbi:hypothetical protein [Kitasatospora sp. NPDC059160]|uniref:hypothetical protein n=1 Tax=Kitasatospora sp. NPDC059160 TaxID=3346748 RepID=UPI00369215B2